MFSSETGPGSQGAAKGQHGAANVRFLQRKAVFSSETGPRSQGAGKGHAPLKKTPQPSTDYPCFFEEKLGLAIFLAGHLGPWGPGTANSCLAMFCSL